MPLRQFTGWAWAGIALVLMLMAEFSLVLWLRGLALSQYLATRDPVSGTVYYLSLYSLL